MKAIDTNVLVRLMVNDDPVQAERAKAFCAGGVRVSLTVAMETEWVLRASYRMPREPIAQIFSLLISADDFDFEDALGLSWAIERYREGGDFSNLLHVVANQGCDAFGTFDGALSREAGTAPLIPIVQV